MKGAPDLDSHQNEARPHSTPGPEQMADILASLTTAAGDHRLMAPAPREAHYRDDPERPLGDEPGLRRWFLHETTTLREPIYRTSAKDKDDGAAAEVAAAEPTQLPLLRYDYGGEISVLSRLGELTARDLRVMSVISQIYWERGCPEDNAIAGDEATLGFICRQLGWTRGFVNLVRASVERLMTTKVLWRSQRTISDTTGAPIGDDSQEVAVGFLTNFGVRRRRVKGQRESRSNFILIDPLMAKLIRDGHFTWLRGDVMRKLRNDPMATKYYSFMRTHRPNDRGEIEYGVALLASKLGCSDKKRSRVRAKILRAAEAVCKAAPEEFPRVHLRPGVRDTVIVQAKSRRLAPPLRVIDTGGHPAVPTTAAEQHAARG